MSDEKDFAEFIKACKRHGDTERSKELSPESDGGYLLSIEDSRVLMEFYADAVIADFMASNSPYRSGCASI